MEMVVALSIGEHIIWVKVKQANSAMPSWSIAICETFTK